MSMAYKERISALLKSLSLEIDLDIVVSGHPPTMASSQFLINKEQGDWAERLIKASINEHPDLGLVAVQYGRSEDLAAGDPGFEAHYLAYQAELNQIGKKPDLLLFEQGSEPSERETDSVDAAKRAVAAIEIRSSAFLAGHYNDFMQARTAEARAQCTAITAQILAAPYGPLLADKRPKLHDTLSTADAATFRELDFRRPSWSSSAELRELTELLRQLKVAMKTLQKRDYLSVTPKLEDIALVNRWIQHFDVPHFYLQVFFDKAYLIPFSKILEVAADSEQEGRTFSIERDVKNQRKSTIKIDVAACDEVVGRIDMPTHASQMKTLDRGRLLFYVTFDGGKGYLDADILRDALRNA